ncbi:MAG: class I SAM-dependent methyltransferase [Rhodospirillales bacterium]|nr:class I SAM-dependent methyltransferase [Rhodospirillales bacterium]
MSEQCYRRSTCRLCGADELSLVLELTPTPPANAFVEAAAVGEEKAAFPLDVYFCETCTHVQLLDAVDPAVLFENYVYVSGTSPVFIRHFEDYARAVIARFDGSVNARLAVDIGSNDGTLLSFFQSHGMSVLGIDPARDIAAAATSKGIETLAEFFSSGLADKLVHERGRAQIITANNVFAHADDLIDIVNGIRTLLAPDGAFVFEVSYLVDVIEKSLFDTIYHEHVAYHSVKPIAAFFEAHGLRLFHAERVDSHGGSLRGYVCHATAPWSRDPSVDELIALEAEMKLDDADTLRTFSAQIDAIGADLSRRLRTLKSEGKKIAAFGAPAKATTLMYHFGIGADIIDFIVDDSPLKQNLYSPGMHIPVLPSAALYERNPDAVVILAWNFAEPIMENHAAYLEAGGTFIVPLPTVRQFG